MGTIYKKGKYYYLNLRIDGRRIRKKIGSSKKIAELALKDYEIKAARKEFGFSIPDLSLKKLFSIFLEYSETNHASSSTKRYLNVIKNFEIFLSLNYKRIKKISQLNPQVFEKYKHFRRTVDPRTIDIPDGFPYEIRKNSLRAKTRTLNYEIKTLRSIFNFGIKHNLCKDNPCQDIPLLKITDSSSPRFLSFSESKKLLDNCDEDLYPILFTFLNTGLRLGELIHLQWGDVNMRRRKLKIQMKKFWRPKSQEREIPLNSGMVELLKKIRPNKENSEDFIFPGKDGGILKKKLRNALIRIAKKAGIENLTKIHSLRHTFASHLVMKGVDLPTVKELMGHSDIQTTMIYAHLAPDHLSDAVNKLKY